MSEELLQDIKSILEDIKFLLLLSNDEKIQQTKNNLLKEGSEQKKIYDLCNGKTNEEIVKIIKKDLSYVTSNISRLREKGLIKTTKENNGKLIHTQRF